MTTTFNRTLTQPQETFQNSPNCGKPFQAKTKKVMLEENQCLSSCTWQTNPLFKQIFPDNSTFLLTSLFFYPQMIYFSKLYQSYGSAENIFFLTNDEPMVPTDLSCLKGCFDKYLKNPTLSTKIQRKCSANGLDRQVPTHTMEGNDHAQSNFSDFTLWSSFVGVNQVYDFPLVLPFNPNLDCLVFYETRERIKCRNTNDGVCNFISPDGISDVISAAAMLDAMPEFMRRIIQRPHMAINTNITNPTNPLKL